MTSNEQRQIERSVVLLLLDGGHVERWSPAELERELQSARGLAVRHAIGELQAADVMVRDGEHVLASRAARKLDELELIAA